MPFEGNIQEFSDRTLAPISTHEILGEMHNLVSGFELEPRTNSIGALLQAFQAAFEFDSDIGIVLQMVQDDVCNFVLANVNDGMICMALDRGEYLASRLSPSNTCCVDITCSLDIF
jgi:hypothetical protein